MGAELWALGIDCMPRTNGHDKRSDGDTEEKEEQLRGRGDKEGLNEQGKNIRE